MNNIKELYDKKPDMFETVHCADGFGGLIKCAMLKNFKGDTSAGADNTVGFEIKD